MWRCKNQMDIAKIARAASKYRSHDAGNGSNVASTEDSIGCCWSVASPLPFDCGLDEPVDFANPYAIQATTPAPVANTFALVEARWLASSGKRRSAILSRIFANTSRAYFDAWLLSTIVVSSLWMNFRWNWKLGQVPVERDRRTMAPEEEHADAPTRTQFQCNAQNDTRGCNTSGSRSWHHFDQTFPCGNPLNYPRHQRRVTPRIISALSVVRPRIPSEVRAPCNCAVSEHSTRTHGGYGLYVVTTHQRRVCEVHHTAVAEGTLALREPLLPIR